MSNGLTSHTTTWNRIRESIMGSEVFTSQIKSYLKNAQVKQAGEDSLVLLLPNSLTKEFIDKSGILAFIHASFLDETGLDIAISTEVTSLVSRLSVPPLEKYSSFTPPALLVKREVYCTWKPSSLPSGP